MNDEELNLKKIGMISTHIKNMIDAVDKEMIDDRFTVKIIKAKIEKYLDKVSELIEKI